MTTRTDKLIEELRALTDRTRATPKEVAAVAAELAGVALDDHPHLSPLSEDELIAEIDKGLADIKAGRVSNATAADIIAEANGRRA